MTEKENVRWRVANAHIDPDNYVFYPAKKQADYYDNDIPQRVAIYVRVSTDSSKQTMSYELQKKILRGIRCSASLLDIGKNLCG